MIRWFDLLNAELGLALISAAVCCWGHCPTHAYASKVIDFHTCCRFDLLLDRDDLYGAMQSPQLRHLVVSGLGGAGGFGLGGAGGW